MEKLGDTELIDTMIKDGLWDAFNGYHMGNTAENVATDFRLLGESKISLLIILKIKLSKLRKKKFKR